MRKLTCILLAVFCMGCTSKPATTIVTSTNDPSPPASTTAADDNARDDVVIIDVRSNEEWESGHVAQAFHIPHTEIAQKIEEVARNKDAKIVLYCAAGGRAGKAKEVLDALGYTDVENAGGYDDIKERYK
ncbi:MAG: rhodanese-like domain-containing protein [Pirellulaceae bacterium]|nr:rhodanese-like domain-containing protein [Pirellulaceae bacterium]